MLERDPTNWTYTTWLLALGMATSGGLINWFSRMKQSKTRKFSIIELVGEIFTSGFVGIGAFMLLDSLGQSPGICAATAGVSGHMATRLLFAVEKTIENHIDKLGRN
jgi:hypothetical protein